MNTDALKTFLVLSELRSFRKTAQQLYIAQSTVSSRIQELERDLGQTLLDRKPRGMTLTPAGHRLVPIAEEWSIWKKTSVRKPSARPCGS